MEAVYLKCHHGIEKRSVFGCPDCEKEKSEIYKAVGTISENKNKDKRIPIYRGCGVGDGGMCFCTGACKEIIGYYE